MYKTDQINTGAIQSAIVQRKRALDKYYANPNHCLHCNQVIHVPEGHKVGETRIKKFCNKSCAALHNNHHFPKRKAIAFSVCERCQCEVPNKKTTSGAYVRRKFCDPCLASDRLERRGQIAVVKNTKSDLYAKTSARGGRLSIGQNARTTYIRSGQPMTCKVCGYATHVQICHIKPVCDFSGDTLVSEINALENLVALCPNHHWELDHHQLVLVL